MSIQSEVQIILNRAIELGLSPTEPKLLRRSDFGVVIIVSYTAPDVADIAALPSDVIFVGADPDDAATYKKAHLKHPFVPGLWLETLEESRLSKVQQRFYYEFHESPVDSDGDKLTGALLPRTLGASEEYADDEVVPLSFVRELISEIDTGGSGGTGTTDPYIEQRIAVAEQEILKNTFKIDNIDTTFNHTQEFRSTIWTVEHGFGEYPSVIQVFDDTGTPVFPQSITPDPDSADRLLVIFSEPVTGRLSAIK